MENLSSNIQGSLGSLACIRSKIFKIDNLYPEVLVCKICQKEFSHVERLKQHLIEELELDKGILDFLDMELGIDNYPDKNLGSTDSQTLSCPVCSKICKNKKGLEQHKAKSHARKKRKSRCKICTKRFLSKYALRFHTNQVHSKTTRVECCECGEKIYNKYLMSSHMKTYHGVIK